MSSTKIHEDFIYQGDSSADWYVARQAKDKSLYPLVGYSCNLSVDGTAINRAIVTQNVTGNAFICQLTPAETAAFVKGQTYKARILLENPAAVPPFRRTLTILVRVRTDDAVV